MTYPTLEEAKMVVAATGAKLNDLNNMSALLVMFLMAATVISWLSIVDSNSPVRNGQPASRTLIGSAVFFTFLLSFFFFLYLVQPLSGSFRDLAVQVVRMDRAVRGEAFDTTHPLTARDVQIAINHLESTVGKAEEMKRLEMLIHPTQTAQANNPFEKLAALNVK